ncbi:MAG: 50S ribosomal protein L15 [Deltaproteobacteria bacterium]|nr:50S ribosomal protein L15 [Deltaproteobacteria bacterium]
MDLSCLQPAAGSKKKNKRVGRGVGSGHGKTACRGHKGQNARSGGKTPPWFEGGQMPIQRRLPKRGFTNHFKKEYAILNIKDLIVFEAGSTLDAAILIESGLIKKAKDGVKILGQGEIDRPLTVKVTSISQSAKAKIEAAGGKVEVS